MADDRIPPLYQDDLESSAETLHLVKTPQLYEGIRDRLIGYVRDGTWKPGQRLPSERELSIALGVSRPTLREALASLQLSRIVVTRHGSGTRITPRAIEIVERLGSPTSSRDYDVSPISLLEVRSVIEPEIASLAAARFDINQGKELFEFINEMHKNLNMSDPRERLIWNRADRLFHLGIARHTKNPIFQSIATFIADVMTQPLWRQLRDDMLASQTQVNESVLEHHRIYDALTNHDIQLAYMYAKKHVENLWQAMDLNESG
jgi:DNA-binding FadR family transcriptional regulator